MKKNKKRILHYSFLMIVIVAFLCCSKENQSFTKNYKIRSVKASPENVEIKKPANNLSTELKALSGKWQGAWNGVVDATLIVKEIKQKSAIIYYSIEGNEYLKIKPLTIEIEADIIKGKNITIYWEYKDKKAKQRFVLSKDLKILRGHYLSDTNIDYIGMRKNIKPGELSKALDLSAVKINNKDSGLDKDWYKKSVFMEIYVRGYNDSDNDGIGDIKGLVQKLDYIKELGIGGIWLMPVFQSSDMDHGYAIENYRTIDEEYGNLDDFKILLKEAHKRKIGVIVDYVINHSSSSNALFEDSKYKYSSKRNWYNWKEKRPQSYKVLWRLGNTNPWEPTNEYGYYYSIFFSGMPDFNLRNPEVVNYHMNTMKFWLNMGVDGFRFDATGHLFENAPNGWDNQPENIVFLKKIRKLLNRYKNKFMICESPTEPGLYAKPGIAAFAFGLQKAIIGSARSGKAAPKMIHYIKTNPISFMGTILSNHDSFAGARTMEEIGKGDEECKIAATTYLLIPGIPFVYYGEEVGMKLANELYNDHKLRSPMSWTDNEDNAGFSKNKKIFRNVSKNISSHNVQQQLKEKDSIYNHYKKLIALRNKYQALSMGSFKHLKSSNHKKKTIFAFKREYKNESFIVAINYSRDDEKDVAIQTNINEGQFKPIYASNSAKSVLLVNSELKVKVPAQNFVIYKKIN